ncbi:MAG: SDR family oxidoreductase [Sphingopyxis sp.]|nr:SDR family oxidoreductase [Sphingopyxis sp.]
MISLSFQGRNALVVGGSSGIGRGIAQALRDAGAATTVWGTRVSATDYEQPDELARIAYRQVDAADDAAVSRATAALDRLDVLILCQGTVRYDRQEFEIETFRQVVDVNLNGMMACAAAAFPLLSRQGGAIVTVSSTAAYHATRGNPAYNASKCGVVGLTRTLGQAWVKKGVRVNGIAPGYVATKLTKVTTEHPDRLEAALATIPLGRMGDPAEMAAAALFLASPAASYIVGQTIIVDGGMTL